MASEKREERREKEQKDKVLSASPQQKRQVDCEYSLSLKVKMEKNSNHCLFANEKNFVGFRMSFALVLIVSKV